MTQGPVIPPPPPPNGPAISGGHAITPGFTIPPPLSVEHTGAITEPATVSTSEPQAEPVIRRRRRSAEQIAADRASTTGPIMAATPEQQTEPLTLRPQTEPPPVLTLAEGNAKPKFWVSAGATINIGNYESFKIDMGVSGIDYDADSAEIERVMASANVGIHETVEALMIKVIERGREIKIARGIPVPNEDD